MGQKLRFRRNVAAILQDEKGRIFIGQRSDRKGAWQFPQGGVDEGESDLGALHREVEEEVGVGKDLYTVEEKRGGYRYTFPGGRMKHGKYHGQEQVYFLCAFRGADADVDLETAHPEFDAYQWIVPGDFQLGWVPAFKRDVYRQVFRDFFAVEL